MKKIYCSTLITLALLLSQSMESMAQLSAMWPNKVAIVIDSTFIDDDLTNWTLVFDQSFSPLLTEVNGPLDADGAAPSLANGADLRFSTDTAGSTELAFDIRSWTTNNDPALAECEVAVKIPFVDKDDYTVIYMWWEIQAPAPMRWEIPLGSTMLMIIIIERYGP
jgi:hypothetical protein